MIIIYIYLILINIAAFAAMATDKIRARKHRWRIPERTLLLLAVLGGSIGAIAGMLIFWHKVRDKMFAVGLPIALAVHLILVFVISHFQG